MKKLNTLFTTETIEIIDNTTKHSMNSKSEIARAAMTIGMSMLWVAKSGLTDREFYSYVNDCQDIDNNLDPKPLEK
ncbi:hypothetical protein NVP1198B_67 [Vibrio phage 1.198.B._10N.286.54.F4]|nr:hypothetical protein NVP1198A_68 [Vibrio phage 1.198.A._10N.286.54.F4]AUR94855.1 hypothetical protein NVP1198B_67 [Vibrio phage 1.198.B._10N.286.54.F4]